MTQSLILDITTSDTNISILMAKKILPKDLESFMSHRSIIFFDTKYYKTYLYKGKKLLEQFIFPINSLTDIKFMLKDGTLRISSISKPATQAFLY